MQNDQRTIHVWVEDKPGVLMRVTNILTAKALNIDRLMAIADPVQNGVCKITVVATIEPRLHSRVVAEMNRLVNVFIAIDVTEDNPDRSSPV